MRLSFDDDDDTNLDYVIMSMLQQHAHSMLTALQSKRKSRFE